MTSQNKNGVNSEGTRVHKSMENFRELPRFAVIMDEEGYQPEAPEIPGCFQGDHVVSDKASGTE